MSQQRVQLVIFGLVCLRMSLSCGKPSVSAYVSGMYSDDFARLCQCVDAGASGMRVVFSVGVSEPVTAVARVSSQSPCKLRIVGFCTIVSPQMTRSGEGIELLLSEKMEKCRRARSRRRRGGSFGLWPETPCQTKLNRIVGDLASCAWRLRFSPLLPVHIRCLVELTHHYLHVLVMQHSSLSRPSLPCDSSRTHDL